MDGYRRSSGVVWTSRAQSVAVGRNVDPARWQSVFEDLMAQVAGRFSRVESRRRARAFVLGLLAELPRKNCWTIAEHAGDTSPAGMQHLLSRASWDADHVRDDIRTFVVEHLGDEDAVLVVDETGDVKKGTRTVGVQRQYTGTAGRVENSQVAVYLVYSASAGHAAIDRHLYIPRSWTQDPKRCQAAGIPEELGFATKPALATEMIGHALDAGVPAAWVTGDEVYGSDPHLSAELERRQIGYVLAVSRKRAITTRAGDFRAGVLAHSLPKRALAAAVSGSRRQGSPHLRLGPGRHRQPARQPGPPVAAYPDATDAPVNSPSTAPTHPVRSRCPRWSRWPDVAGPWRRPSRPPRAWQGWTSTRSAGGPPGTAGPPWPCSRTHASRSRPPSNEPPRRQRQGSSR